MTATPQLQMIPGSTAGEVRFVLAFPAPGSDEAAAAAPVCAAGRLQTGDGQSYDVGVLCAPSAYDWQQRHHVDLAVHRYAAAGSHTARLAWNGSEWVADISADALPEPRRPALPQVMHFETRLQARAPLTLSVHLKLGPFDPDQQVRVDGGAGQNHVLSGLQSAPSDTEWLLEYAKPGGYPVTVQLLDGDGFWLADLAQQAVELPEPEEEAAEELQVLSAEDMETLLTPLEVPTIQQANPPWLPFRYARPTGSSARAYTAPGGNRVARTLYAGTYIAIAAEVIAAGQLWYRTSLDDWAPASSVTVLRPSELRGVVLGDAAPPPPPPPPPGQRRGVVTADLLNVRAQPGVAANNPPVAQLRRGAEVDIYEERSVAGAVWYRIGQNRWVHSGYIRLIEDAPPPPPPPPPAQRRGVVTADVLNVRARPGVAADNPPVAQLRRDAEVQIFAEAVAGGAVWYRIGDDRWVHSAWIRLIQSAASLQVGADGIRPMPSARTAQVVSLPVGWVHSQSLNVRARPGDDAGNPAIDVLAHNQAVPILEQRTVTGQPWYRIGSDRWVYGRWVAAARLRSRPSSIRSNERWVGVSLRDQTAVAYEGDKPVYAAMVATGLPGTPTVQGVYRSWWRLEWRKMSGGSPGAGYYYLEAVTWTCYFYSGYALHTAYWHDAFGSPRSRGCVNLSPYDAWWIFQWSAAGGANSPAVYVYA